MEVISAKGSDYQNENKMFQKEIPKWARAFIKLGEEVARLAQNEPDRHSTLALCLPRVDFAAAFVTVGLIKGSLGKKEISSEKDRLNSLVGQWVTIKSNTGIKKPGILEYCDSTERFKILHYKKDIKDPNLMTYEQRKRYKQRNSVGLWTVVDPSKWTSIVPCGRQYNIELGAKESQVKNWNQEMEKLHLWENILEIDHIKNIESRGSICCIYGDRSRITSEIEETIIKENKISLETLLRPDLYIKYQYTCKCRIFSERTDETPSDKEIVVIEAGPCFSDKLLVSNKSHRIILLGRNSRRYEESAKQVNELYEDRSETIGNNETQVFSSAIKTLHFFR